MQPIKLSLRVSRAVESEGSPNSWGHGIGVEGLARELGFAILVVELRAEDLLLAASPQIPVQGQRRQLAGRLVALERSGRCETVRRQIVSRRLAVMENPCGPIPGGGTGRLSRNENFANLHASFAVTLVDDAPDNRSCASIAPVRVEDRLDLRGFSARRGFRLQDKGETHEATDQAHRRLIASVYTSQRDRRAK